jgi:archaemetzincin
MKRMCLLIMLSSLLLACMGGEEKPASNMAAARAEKDRRAELRAAITKIEPFFKRMGKPQPFDWLASFKEPGQTFDEYLDSDPVVPTDERKIIYIQPLGTFTADQTKIIRVTSDYMQAFYGLPVKSLPAKAFGNIPVANVRVMKYAKKRQIKTGYILDTVLRPALPADAAALIAFTNEDLFPDPSMNYVFGQASLENRVGVWSLDRMDDNADFDTFLQRTMKIAVHETGHMFSFRHCTKHECVMSGTNHLSETDARPIDACPECMAKICWMAKTEPKDRYKNLMEFCRRNGMPKEADEFAKKMVAVQ